jgi:hypothetical protein
MTVTVIVVGETPNSVLRSGTLQSPGAFTVVVVPVPRPCPTPAPPLLQPAITSAPTVAKIHHRIAMLSPGFGAPRVAAVIVHAFRAGRHAGAAPGCPR